MTAQRAIKILSDSAHGGTTTFNQDFKEAEKLGIEALKEWVKRRQGMSLSDVWLLKGETAD